MHGGELVVAAVPSGDAAHPKTTRRRHHHLRTARAVSKSRLRLGRPGAIRVPRGRPELRQAIRHQRSVDAIGKLTEVRLEVRRVRAAHDRLPEHRLLLQPRRRPVGRRDRYGCGPGHGAQVVLPQQRRVLHLQQIQTSVTDKANGRSPEESQEALLSAKARAVAGRADPGAASMDAVNAIKGHDASGPAGARAVSPAPAPPASRPSPRLGHHLRCRRKSCSTAPPIAALRTRIPARPVSDAAAWRDV